MKITKDNHRYKYTSLQTINEKLMFLDVIACSFCMEASTENYILAYYFK